MNKRWTTGPRSTVSADGPDERSALPVGQGILDPCRLHDVVPQTASVIGGEPRHRRPVEGSRSSIQIQLAGGPGTGLVRRQPEQGVDAGGGGPEDRSHHARELRERGREPRRRSPTRMHGIHRESIPTRWSEPSRPFPDQRDLRPLRTGVRPGPIEFAPLVPQIVKIERLGVHAARGHRDDASLTTRAEQREQLRDQTEKKVTPIGNKKEAK